MPSTVFLKQLASIAVACSLAVTAIADVEQDCPGYQAGEKQLFWGDLHVHTGYSLDAYAFGVRHDPTDAFNFGRGQPLFHTDSKTLLQIDRPLDFMAVTDHAETFAVMYLCGDPAIADTEYCRNIQHDSVPETGLDVFRKYLLPIVLGKRPEALCDSEGVDCNQAAIWQWQRAKRQANAANTPCEFTAFVAQEWSATPGAAHMHRNLIFKGENAPEKAFDYLTYNSPEKLWTALEKECKSEEGCDVLAIPHNSNLSDGQGFDVENRDAATLQLRAKYERLIEVFQSKGNSECLPSSWTDENADCNFEIVLDRPTSKVLGTGTQEEKQAKWEKIKASYVRPILNRGLQAFSQDKADGVNPMQLGFVGSTDTHSANPGDVTENDWQHDVWSVPGDIEGAFSRINYNPGGIVGVWAEQNTRDDIYQALWRREAYATSGPRISLRIFADTELTQRCSAPLNTSGATVMGGTLPQSAEKVWLTVMAQKDDVLLQSIEVIKAMVKGDKVEEKVIPVATSQQGKNTWCHVWQDEEFDSKAAAYWYVRVKQVPTSRWSKTDCEEAGLCEKYPNANVDIQERAWSSPIWYLPK